MRFVISRSSTCDYVPSEQPLPEAFQVGNEWFIDLEPAEILSLAERLQERIIITAGEQPQIQIYDDYRE